MNTHDPVEKYFECVSYCYLDDDEETCLNACVEKKVSRFIFASSMYVYSSFGSFYNASKKSSEIIIEAFNQEYGLDFTFLRYGSLYGPRAQDWNGINSFLKLIVNEGKLDYFGSGEEKREYIHVSDAADLSLEILSKAL